jgi:hypothetical protein
MPSPIAFSSFSFCSLLPVPSSALPLPLASNELVGIEKAALYFNDEGLQAEQRGKELLRYYFENLKPSGEVPYLLFDIPELAGRVRGLDWVGGDPERDSARFNARIPVDRRCTHCRQSIPRRHELSIRTASYDRTEGYVTRYKDTPFDSLRGRRGTVINLYSHCNMRRV